MSFWKRLFRKAPRPSPDTVKTAPLDIGVLGQAPPVRGVRRMVLGAAQSTGIERTHNEDALFYMIGRADGQEPLPDFGVFVVADGMGGHRSGEVASSISVRTVARKITAETIVHLFDIETQNEAPSLQELVQEALEEANLAVVDRAYLITRDEARALTRDHSLVQRLVELEQLTEEEAALHPQRNVLWNAIGQGANLKVDVFTEPVPHGGYMLVCSDGLWGTVPESDIRRIVLNAGDPQTACDQLIQAANGAGGPDNITAILIYFPSE